VADIAGHLVKVREGQGVEKQLGRPRILTAQQESILVDVILDMEKKCSVSQKWI